MRGSKPLSLEPLSDSAFQSYHLSLSMFLKRRGREGKGGGGCRKSCRRLLGFRLLAYFLRWLWVSKPTKHNFFLGWLYEFRLVFVLYVINCIVQIEVSIISESLRRY